MKETTIAYLAGIIDGEGCIRVKKSKAYKCQGRVTPGYHASMHVRMVEPIAVALLKKHFGGCLYKEKKPTGLRPLHCWNISDRQAGAAAKNLLPFLRIKRRQAKLILRLRAVQGNRERYRTKIVGQRNFPNSHGAVRVVNNLAFSDAYVARCEALFIACKKLNRVGIAALV